MLLEWVTTMSDRFVSLPAQRPVSQNKGAQASLIPLTLPPFLGRNQHPDSRLTTRKSPLL